MAETKSHWTNNSTIRKVHSMVCSRNAAGQRYSHHSSYKYIILFLSIIIVYFLSYSNTLIYEWIIYAIRFTLPIHSCVHAVNLRL